MQCVALDSSNFIRSIGKHDPMYAKILVPYDGSEPANRALDHAVNIAKSYQSKADVTLLHVISEFPTRHFIDRPTRSIKTGEKISLSRYIKEIYEMMEENANDALVAKKEEIKKSSDFEIETAVISGHVSDTLVEFVKNEKVDLVVIGNVGRPGLSRIRTLGSVSRSVAERASCPVMIVH